MPCQSLAVTTAGGNASAMCLHARPFVRLRYRATQFGFLERTLTLVVRSMNSGLVELPHMGYGR